MSDKTEYCKFCHNKVMQDAEKAKNKLLLKELENYLLLDYPMGEDFFTDISLRMVNTQRAGKRIYVKGISANLARRCSKFTPVDITNTQISIALKKLESIKPEQFQSFMCYAQRLWLKIPENASYKSIDRIKKQCGCDVVTRNEFKGSYIPVKTEYIVIRPKTCKAGIETGCKTYYKRIYDQFQASIKFVAVEIGLLDSKKGG
jgi:hypothetical protein